MHRRKTLFSLEAWRSAVFDRFYGWSLDIGVGVGTNAARSVAVEEDLQPPLLRDQEEIPSSSDFQIQEWETRVRAWLSMLPIRRNVMMIEMEAWVDSNMVTLPQELKVLPRPELYKRILSISKHMRRSNQVWWTLRIMANWYSLQIQNSKTIQTEKMEQREQIEPNQEVLLS
ncbi:hypothetical protein NE237_026097 [Protea cynaroides]|uniref:Uncharacterized protein n=1 Tax=Protea cynaroides TaxID=273540 RepID=A0A9Q0H346_9MAGN|nr:hypothetical protein NE237_026097 [Protea cynaroides]